jgi:hypothetical protein
MQCNNKPHKVILKQMTVDASFDKTYSFFEDVKKSMEAGKAAANVAKGDDGWWTFDHVAAGKSKLRHAPVREAGVIDHIFSGGGLEWNVYVRIVPNNGGSTTTWTFIKPDGLTDEQFTNQLAMFDNEIELWKQEIETA